MNYRTTTTLLAAVLAAAPLQASERVSGHYTASQSCEAYASFARSHNPGAVRTAPGTRYTALEVNKPGDYDWVRIEVPGAEPRQRWVRRDCGAPSLDTAAQAPRSTTQDRGGLCSRYDQHDSYVLAVSWQPGFCEHVKFKGRKPECTALNGGSLTVDHLTLHGLWPNRKECGISYGHCKAADGSPRPFALKDATVARIAPWMPNFRYERAFGKYEWDKHGSCQALGPDAYFEQAVAAVRILNDSEIGKLVRSHIGTRMPVRTFFERIRQRYGNAVANNTQLVCAGDGMLHEIRFRLPRDFVLGPDLGKLVGGSGFRAPAESCGDSVYVERSGPN